MPPVGFEPTIPLFEQEETVHALGQAAAVMGGSKSCQNVAVGYSPCTSVCTCVCVPASQLLCPAVTDCNGPSAEQFRAPVPCTAPSLKRGRGEKWLQVPHSGPALI
jgi:hypothetical protein